MMEKNSGRWSVASGQLRNGEDADKHSGAPGELGEGAIPLLTTGQRPPGTSSGFTLIEMLTTVAVLIIVLGLMVSLARFVRDRSAQEFTREVLRQLDELLVQYEDHHKGAVPVVERLLPANTKPDMIEDAAFARAARVNNEEITKALRTDYRAHQTDPNGLADPFEQLPISMYDKGTLRDAWGSPIVFMPGQHPLIGLAPSRAGQDQAFFFSAGQDKRYLTRGDNIYSYETMTP